nr:ribonuclease H-like domain-containing protein [Tanacetum cinerariifolium]
EDAIEEGAAKIYNLIAGADTEEASTAGWDDYAFSVFTTNSKDVEGRPLFNRFAKTDSMKAVPPPLSGDYTSLSDHIDLDESQINKSSEVNTNNFASSDSSVKSSEPKPNDSTSCALTSSVSTSANEAEIESNVRTPIQEPIIVQDLPSFSCNSSDKNENTSRTCCNKNGYFNKKAAVLLRTGKVNIPPTRPQPVPTGKPKVFAPVPTGGQNRPFLVPTDRGYSPLVISGWWKSTARPMPHFSRSTSTYFQSYTPYVPTIHYNRMKYGRDRWATAVKPSADAEDEGVFDSGCSRSMTGNKERLDDFQVFQDGKVAFEGGEGRITGKGIIQTPTLDFENVYYVKELQQFNLFSIS